MLRKITSFRLGKLVFLLLFANFIICLGAQLVTSLPAKAECVYQGKTYQTGESAGPYVCMPDGSMQPQ
jgi:hypothetical protein